MFCLKMISETLHTAIASCFCQRRRRKRFIMWLLGQTETYREALRKYTPDCLDSILSFYFQTTVTIVSFNNIFLGPCVWWSQIEEPCRETHVWSAKRPGSLRLGLKRGTCFRICTMRQLLLESQRATIYDSSANTVWFKILSLLFRILLMTL